ncbi:hypothetical protein ACFUKZ_35355, partial [Streptomyces sp. NPDC057250]
MSPPVSTAPPHTGETPPKQGDKAERPFPSAGPATTASGGTMQSSATVLVYSDDANTRAQVRLAAGRRPA